MHSPPSGDGRASGAYASRRLPPQPTSTGEASLRRPGRAAPAARGQRELVLHPDPQDHRVARPREAEARADDELEAPGESAVERREDVVLLLARRLETTDLPGVAEEFDAGHEVARETIVHACAVVELQGAALRRHRG